MSVFRSIVVCIALLTSLSACDQDIKTESKSADFVKRAESYFKQGQFSAATIEAQNALKENKDNVSATLLLAKISQERGNFSQAQALLNDLPLDNPEVVVLLGENYLLQNKFNSLDKLLTDTKNAPFAAKSWAYNRLVTISNIQRQQYREALASIKTMSPLAGSTHEKAATELTQSVYFAAQNQRANELAALDKALSIEPSNVEALIQKAKLKLAEENLEAAEDLLSQALIALPNTDMMTLQRLSLLQGLVSILTKQGRSGEAMVYSKLIADANPKAQEIQDEFEKGIETIKAGNLQAAEKIFSQLYLSNNTRLAGSMLGLIKYQQGDFEEAKKFFDQTVDAETASATVVNAYAESQLKMYDPTEALKTIESNINSRTDNPDTLSIYGLALIATGQMDKAIGTLEKVLTLDPSRTRIRFALAKALNSVRKHDEALAQLRTCYKELQNDVAVQEALMQQLRAMGKEKDLNDLTNTLASSNNPQSQILAGLSLLKNSPERGAAILDSAYKASPTDNAVLLAQIKRYAYTKDYDKVIRYGKELISIDNNSLPSLMITFEAYLKSDKKEEGIRYFEKIASDNINAWGPDYLFASYYLSSGDFEKAIEYANQAITKSGFNRETSQLSAHVHYVAAEQTAKTGAFDKARATIMEALQQGENSPALTHLLINVELADNQIGEAEKLLADLKKSQPTNFFTYFSEGDIAFKKSDNESALNYFRQAWSQQAADSLAVKIWSLSQQDLNLADSFLTDWVKKLPGSYRAHTFAGMHYQKLGSAQKAVQHYKQSLALAPNQPTALNNLAWILMESNQLDDAYKYAKTAANMAPENPSVLDTYGWIAFKSGKKEEAKTALAKAGELAPDVQEIKDHQKAVGL